MLRLVPPQTEKDSNSYVINFFAGELLYSWTEHFWKGVTEYPPIFSAVQTRLHNKSALKNNFFWGFALQT
jgi:hypothetical protein